MEKNKVKVSICGSDYYITTEDDPKYVLELANNLDETLSKIVHDNSRLSITQAAILASLDYADTAKKATDTADNLRAQIKEYLEDSARYKMEAEVAKRDVERLNKEIQSLRSGSMKSF
ncbi:MAG: cell division protein ZapA [Clostridia bacterium]|nr:cell division protein ZapA [Candidatus Limimonas egerieequi]MCQ2489532.1 cell division protein ZapA [Clostridia bacterium]